MAVMEENCLNRASSSLARPRLAAFASILDPVENTGDGRGQKEFRHDP
jgi:hypothetical protein